MFEEKDLVIDWAQAPVFGSEEADLLQPIPTVTVFLQPTDKLIEMAGKDAEVFSFAFNRVTRTGTSSGIGVYTEDRPEFMHLERSALAEAHGLLAPQVEEAFGRSLEDLLDEAETWSILRAAKEANIVCDACGRPFSPEIKEIQKGSFECRYIQCPRCGASVALSVTDPKLRKMMARCSSRETPPEKRQKLLADCVDRTRKLMRYFPMEKFLDPAWNPG